MEARFGRSFTHVRIHDDAAAANTARSLGADAYTVGQHVAFASGRYAPATAAGRLLLAHELAHTVQQGGSGRLVQRQASGDHAAAARFNDAISRNDHGAAVQALLGMSDADIRAAVPVLDAVSRNEIRDQASALGTASGDRVAELVEAAEPTAPRATATPAAATHADVASMSRADRLMRAGEYAMEQIGPELRHELSALLSPRSIAAMVGFAALFIAAQLTPAGWIADAMVAALLTMTVLFVGWAAISIARDIARFLSAINATSDDELRDSGQALARAAARAGIGIIVALLTRGIGRAGGQPPGGASATATAEMATAGGMRITVPINTVREVPAAIPRHLSNLSYAVMVPPPGGRAGGGGSDPGGRGSRRTDPDVDEAVDRAFDEGRVRSDAPLRLHGHGSARTARRAIGVSGRDVESAHGAPRSAMSTTSGYSARAALARLLPRDVHRSMDAFWQQEARRLVASGRSTWTAQEMFEAVSQSILRTRGLSRDEMMSHIARLQDEIFVEWGLRPSDPVRLPFS